MKIEVKFEGNLKDLMAEEIRDAERAVTGAIRDAGARIKAGWREQVASRLSARLGNAVRSKNFPPQGFSIGAAAMVYTRAPKVIDAFDRGVTIRARDGYWLAIPTKAAGRARGGKKITPAEWQRRNGIKLRPVQSRRGEWLLVADGARYSTSAKTQGVAKVSRSKRGKAQSIVIFTLVPQVRLPKRLSLQATVDSATSGLVSDIVARWRASR